MANLQRNRFKVKLFKAAIGVSNWLAALPNKLVPPPFRLIQMGTAYWQSRALFVAADLGLADALADDGKSTRELALELGLDEDHLYRLLRMLATLGVFAETGVRVFCNTALSDCLRRDHPQSVRAMVLMHNSAEMTRAWTESLGECIRSGETPFVKTHGMALFDYMDTHPHFDALFTEAMASVEALTGLDYLHDFNWNRFERIIDVGGSRGDKAIAILMANPHLRALVFDREQVIEGADGYWRDKLEPALFERVAFAGGDMFEAVPVAASERDLYLCIAIFHALDDADAGRLLEQIARGMGTTRASLVIVDAVAASPGIDPSIAAFDMQMLIGTRGRERTLAEWEGLLEHCGFGITQVVEVRTFAKMLVAQRR